MGPFKPADPTGVDVVYDFVGADTFATSLDCLRPRGTLVSFGEASSPIPGHERRRNIRS
ncbi:zinc-binding dehydrogenase [Rhizobium bangladeshense]|uniref:zinc-binding dehydrogenase n=1 Tax=Rhizobium bangladeshense TaxID=1138189 RepID=UPI0035C8A57B